MYEASEPYDASADVMAMSFLDVLSCGLGGAICLFLVFSVLPHSGDQSSVVGSQGSASKQTAFLGARFRDFSDVVRNAHVVIEIRSDKRVANDAIHIIGLRPMQKKFISTSNAGMGSLTTIQIPNGVDPRRVLRITYEGALRGEVTFTAKAKVGVSRDEESGQLLTSNSLNIASDARLELFSIDFKRDGAWIESIDSD